MKNVNASRGKAFLVLTCIVMLVGVLLIGCGGSADETAASDTQEAIEQNQEAVEQKLEELEQETAALEQELEAAEQEREALEQELAEAQDLSESQFVGVWNAVSIQSDGDWIELSKTNLQIEYHLNADGTVLVMATGHADIETTWEEHDGEIVIKSSSGTKPDLTGTINGYGQLIIENDAENTTAAFEKR